MISWCYKWLPIIFGCHCRSDRSFHWKGKQFPICARCTGELAGMLLCIPISFFWIPSAALAALVMVPMVVDGFVQLKTRYESTNIRRFLTGFFFGWGLLALFILSSGAAFRFGYNLTL